MIEKRARVYYDNCKQSLVVHEESDKVSAMMQSVLMIKCADKKSLFSRELRISELIRVLKHSNSNAPRK